MVIGLVPKLALATVAAVGLYIPTLGLPLTGSCMPTIAVAGAAPAPPPSCGGDLRECLRLSADLRQTTFGGRYVTAEDVARCMETFNACIHGSLHGGNPAPPTSTSAADNSRKGLPQRFGIDNDYIAIDCRVSGETVTCTESMKTPGTGVDSFTGMVTGTLDGLTMTGTATSHLTGHDVGEPACTYTEDISGPVTYIFSPDGTVMMRQGPNQRQKTNSGSCSGSDSGTTPLWENTGKWSAIE